MLRASPGMPASPDARRFPGDDPPGPGRTEPEAETTPPEPPFPAEVPRPHASEAAERAEALQRGRACRLRSGADDEARARRLAAWEENPAFAALADNIRDYAVFLLNVNGVITFWGEGAHLMKWWTKEEAEGAHLRLLYPEGGSEDGTAEEHLRQAEMEGEYVGAGHRIRRDGSTFLAGVSLTALRDPDGNLFGFAKTTRDLTARRAAEASLATANAAHTARGKAEKVAEDARTARDRAEEDAAFAREHARGASEYIRTVLEPELAAERALRRAHGRADGEDAARGS